jgi:hypothetical protein
VCGALLGERRSDEDTPPRGRQVQAGVRVQVPQEEAMNIHDSRRNLVYGLVKQTPEYKEYAKRVVELCVELSGEHNRTFWEKECDWFEPFLAGDDAYETAETNVDDARR